MCKGPVFIIHTRFDTIQQRDASESLRFVGFEQKLEGTTPTSPADAIMEHSRIKPNKWSINVKFQSNGALLATATGILLVPPQDAVAFVTDAGMRAQKESKRDLTHSLRVLHAPAGCLGEQQLAPAAAAAASTAQKAASLESRSLWTPTQPSSACSFFLVLSVSL